MSSNGSLGANTVVLYCTQLKRWKGSNDILHKNNAFNEFQPPQFSLVNSLIIPEIKKVLNRAKLMPLILISLLDKAKLSLSLKLKFQTKKY